MPRSRTVRSEAKETTQEVSLGRQVLSTYPLTEQIQFNLRSRLTIDENAITNGIWNLHTYPSHTAEKIALINAVAQKINFLKQKPKRFSYYLLLNGPYKGIYKNWAEIVQKINEQNEFMKSNWKGYEDLDSCLNQAYQSLGLNFYVDPEIGI